MIELIFKTLACSGLFIAFYLLILQREKMFAFNRFYLIATLLLSFAIPFMEFGMNQMENVPVVAEVIPVEIAKNDINIAELVAQKNVEKQTISTAGSSQSTFNWWILVPLIYLVLTLVMLLRFISNLLNLFVMTRMNDRIQKQGFTIVSVKTDISTFSFFNYLFVPKNEIHSERIQPEIFRHELAHMKQKHSFDVLLIEFLKIFFWFNPFLYMYKKSIQTNHEFLADAEVLNQNLDTVHYQRLLLEKVSAKSQTALASPFNYLVTKKRFIMMTKKTSRMKTIALKLFSIPLLVITMLVFSEKVSAQVQPGKGVSKEMFREYKKQVRKATVKVKNADGTKTEKIQTENLDTELLANIYNQMSDEQKLKVKPLPQNKSFNLNLGDLGVHLGNLGVELGDMGVDLGNINVDLGDLGVELGNLGVDLGDMFSSPEFLDLIAGINIDSEEIQKYADSPEMQKKIKEIEKKAAEIEKYYDSPEFNKKIKDIEDRAAEIEKYYDSPEFKKKIEDIERKAAEIEKYYDSPEFQNKIKEIERKAEEMGKEAEKKAAEAERKAKKA
ncbi:M56 family metallopeptidase [Moheibacter sediminis]|uniref:Signal transducer regulating beta-lactamase production, contains metallopeptidase domain n=1 Tax=Moheibacter sediminis TaxID=1434700 RepID=A0A1W1YI29_9FLAO|nr:M56 family metallopeptidase [Moheibacter sediminis]SMC35776.1 Signal transducer regulating beta-lactamase production, contains metallopeptidase domain [Moheibacter sediminis]